MRKDEIDGFFQRHQKKLAAMGAVAAGALITIAAQAACLAGPESAQQLCLAAVPVVKEKAVQVILDQSGPELCEPEARCTSVFGSSYTLPELDGGVCRCVSK